MEPAERMRALLRYANYTHVAQGLTKAGYPVSGATVSRWAQGRNVTPMGVKLVEQLFADTQESAPAWAEALANETARKVIAALVDPAVLAGLPAGIAVLEEPQQSANGSPHATDESPSQVEQQR